MRAAIIALAVVVTAPSAFAQGRPPEPPPWALEMEVRGGAGWFLDTSAPGVVNTQRLGTERLGPGPLGEFRFGARATPWFSAGVHLAAQGFFGGRLPSTLTDGSAGMVTGGLDARFYLGSALHWRWIEPWVSAGVDPLAQLQLGNHLASGVGSTGTVQSLTSSVGGVAFPMTVGLDVNLTSVFAVGVLARLSPFVPVSRCASDPSGQIVGTACSGNDLATETAITLAGGVRVTLPN